MRMKSPLPKYVWLFMSVLLALGALAISQIWAPGFGDELWAPTGGGAAPAEANPNAPSPATPPLIGFTPARVQAIGPFDDWRSGQSAACMIRTAHDSAPGAEHSIREASLLCPGGRSYRAMGQGEVDFSWAERADGVRIATRGTWRGTTSDAKEIWLEFGARSGRLRLRGDVGAGLDFVVLDWSLPVLGAGPELEPSGPRSAIEAPLHVAARPVSVTGRPPMDVLQAERDGAKPCELWVRPSPSPASLNANCRLLLTCGQSVIYGRGDSGWSTCSRDERGHAAAARDAEQSRLDGDPEMRFNWPERQIIIADEGWSARFALSAHPRCDVAMSWASLWGPMQGGAEGSGPAAVTMRWESGAEVRAGESRIVHGVDGRGHAFSGALTLDCESGRILADFGDQGRYELEYGWGFRVAAGYRVRDGVYSPWVGSNAVDH